MSSGFVIRQTKQGECTPVCTHCRSKELVKGGFVNRKQRYTCRVCRRTSYGLLPDIRPTCPKCRGMVTQKLMQDGRYQYRCPHCPLAFLSEYYIARQQPGGERCIHPFHVWLDTQARNQMVAYMQAVQCTRPQAVRAIFAHVLTGKVFAQVMVASIRYNKRNQRQPIARDPAAAAMRFPNLQRETAKRMAMNQSGQFGRGFLHTILGVCRLSVMLDDAAKEGLVYAMYRLQMNHADAARWLLANAQIPQRE